MNSYHVLELVGEGSFGRVYKGRKRFTGQVVALKFMPKLGRTEKELRSLKREIEIMRDLQHPNIVQLFDSFETDTEVVVVTEYAEGQLFQILVDDGSLPENQVRDIACQLVSALYYLHSHRILHRDMKPQNILLGKNGVVKLCDFGFARAMSVSTLVLTSIKGTPLYMSPELVEEKPYDHTADLWSLGCILYELHTGAPPFYTNSIFHLVQLIVRDPVKWPDTMSDTCTSFLKGLLTKDPQKRLSWPDLLYHPFVADDVLVLSDTSVFSPLTVMPSPDMLALKLQQVVAKTATSGGSRLLRKAREQEEKGVRRMQAGEHDAKKKKDRAGNARAKSATDASSPRAKAPYNDITAVSDSFANTACHSFSPRNEARVGSNHRGQISRDYEQEFPSAEGGPRLLRRCTEERHDVDSEEYWEKLAQESEPCRQRQEALNHSTIIAQLKSKILTFQAQLTGGTVKEERRIHQPLMVLRNLIVTSDPEELKHMSRELTLPDVLFELVHNALENSDFLKRPWSVPTVGEMIALLVVYWQRNCDWAEEEHRLDELVKPFTAALSRPDLVPLAPLAASALSLFVHHGVAVEVDVDSLTSLLKNLLSDSSLSLRPGLPGWGVCDGLLFLLLHTLSEHENGSGSSRLDPELFLDLWKRIGTSLAETRTDADFCSADGLYSFLSITLLVFIQDPYMCIPLFSQCQSECVHTLGQLLAADRLHLFAAGCPERPADERLSGDSMSMLSCHLLCFPFALDVPPRSMSAILQLYHSGGVVESLVQVIQTLPPELLELPLSLLSRLLLSDLARSVSHLRRGATCGLFTLPAPPRSGRLTASPDRTASSLLDALLQAEELWDGAVELLTVLSQLARCGLPLSLEPPVLHQALAHPQDGIRAGACRLLGNLDSFRSAERGALSPDVLRSMIGCLHDSCVSVRRAACRAVGNWLGHVAWFNMWRDREAAGRREERGLNKQCWDGEVGEEEGRRWVEEARTTASKLPSLISDPDAVTRRHCCAALGNLVNVEGAAALLLKEGVLGSLLRAACSDPHDAVRHAATAALCQCSEQDAMRQVLISLDAKKKLLLAWQDVPPQCDYAQLIAQL